MEFSFKIKEIHNCEVNFKKSVDFFIFYDIILVLNNEQLENYVHLWYNYMDNILIIGNNY